MYCELSESGYEMKTAIITVAGISSRFNEGVPENKKELKAIYTENSARNTLLYHLLLKCSYMDKIIIVGGYKFEALEAFCRTELAHDFPQAELLKNNHYKDLSSGYSLFLGIRKAMEYKSDEVLFAEGDLDIDNDSFDSIIQSEKSVLTYTGEPIYANRAVVLYRDGNGRYKYAFNSAHGLLTIEEPFSCILNSGQIWKFVNADALKSANDEFEKSEIDGTNLRIIQRYIEKVSADSIELIKLNHWVNCNTREDYRNILNYWRNKK